jgi:regulator of protease activity HflC (stomatin/prohibitin superfamily)
LLGALCTVGGAIGHEMLGRLLIGLYLMFAIKVADQWKKAAVLRLGRYQGLRGPGAFQLVPGFPI